MSRHQQSVIEYLIEENRVVRQQIGRRRMRFDDDQRRRLAARAKRLGRRKLLAEVATIVTPETALSRLRHSANYSGRNAAIGVTQQGTPAVRGTLRRRSGAQWLI